MGWCSYVPTRCCYFKCFVGAWKSKSPWPQSSTFYCIRQLKCGCLVAFVVFTRTPPTHYYLESSGQMHACIPTLSRLDTLGLRYLKREVNHERIYKMTTFFKMTSLLHQSNQKCALVPCGKLLPYSMMM